MARRRFGSTALLIAMLAALLGAASGRPAPTRAASDLLPDLQMLPLSDFRIETTSAGKRLLRFTATMANVGRGPFELRGSRSSGAPTMSVQQVIYDDAGGSRGVATTASMRYAGDGHDHWHVQRIMHYEARSLSGVQRPTNKTDFCFFDTLPHRLSLPGAPQSPRYAESGCGVSSSLATRVGISVGWADTYPWNFVGQWIDITGVAAGEYTIHAQVDPNRHFAEVSETNNCAWTRVTIPASGSTVGVVSRGSVCLVPATRLAGPDRYATAAAVSSNRFPSGVPVAYVASGETFPDALSAGPPAAIRGGPVLIVQRDGIPAAIANELRRLRPGRIVLVGGPGAVSDRVLGLLDGYDTGGGATRIGGADRYATAAGVSEASFTPGPSVAYVATGTAFPDALSAVPAAARQGGPVLLVEPGSIPDSTRAELARLQPRRIVVVGGPSVVSEAVRTALDAFDAGGGVTRLSGPDRYATAAAVSQATFAPPAPVAYLATGENFPDALAAGPAAAIAGGPVLLTRATNLIAATSGELDRLRPARLMVAGGPAAVSDSVVVAAQAVAH